MATVAPSTAAMRDVEDDKILKMDEQKNVMSSKDDAKLYTMDEDRME